jgi:2-methylcitrate dehydratase
VKSSEQQRFLSVVAGLAGMAPATLGALNVRVDPEVLAAAPRVPSGIFG